MFCSVTIVFSTTALYILVVDDGSRSDSVLLSEVSVVVVGRVSSNSAMALSNSSNLALYNSRSISLSLRLSSKI